MYTYEKSLKLLKYLQRHRSHLQNSPSAKIRYQYMILLKNYFWNARSYIWESQNAFCTEDYNMTALTIEACYVSDGPGH